MLEERLDVESKHYAFEFDEFFYITNSLKELKLISQYHKSNNSTFKAEELILSFKEGDFDIPHRAGKPIQNTLQNQVVHEAPQTKDVIIQLYDPESVLVEDIIFNIFFTHLLINSDDDRFFEAKLKNLKAYLFKNNVSESIMESVLVDFKKILNKETNTSFSFNSNKISDISERYISKFLIEQGSKLYQQHLTNNSYTSLYYNINKLYVHCIHEGINVQIVTHGIEEINNLKNSDGLLKYKNSLNQLLLRNTVTQFNVPEWISQATRTLLWQSQFVNSKLSPHSNELYHLDKKIVSKLFSNSSIFLSEFKNIEKQERQIKNYINNEGNAVAGLYGNDVVIGDTKLASTWICKLIQEYCNENLDYDITNQQARDIGVFMINDKKIWSSAIDYWDVKKQNYIKKVIEQTKKILSNEVDGKLFILVRNPAIRYIQSLKEDLFDYLDRIKIIAGRSEYIKVIHSFVENEPNYKIWKDDIDLYTLKGDFHTRDFLKDNVSNVELIYTFIKNLLSWHLQINWKNTPTTFTEDWWNDSFSQLGGKRNPYNWYPKNIRTRHYSPYYSVVLNFLSRWENKKNVVVLDIDEVNITEIITKNTENKKLNKTPEIIKACFYKSFIDILENDENLSEEVVSLVNTDHMVYQILKNSYPNHNE